MTKIQIDTTTPVGAVEAFYTYIKARNLEKAFDLISTERKSTITSFEEWAVGYTKTLHVDLVMTDLVEDEEDIVRVKIESQDWIDGDLVFKYFEGTWDIVEEDGEFRLDKSNMKQIENPEWDWFYYWEDEEKDLGW